MKQKTSTISIYTPYGRQRPGRCIEITYRGKLIKEFWGMDEFAMIEIARNFTKNLGFTRDKIRYVVGG